jgi:hypothetical protein
MVNLIKMVEIITEKTLRVGPPPSFLAHPYHFDPEKQVVVGKTHQEKNYVDNTCW